ncbi:uncharacterized protein EV154DRAFT_597887 [Mucor mucedo]|uniref:uncharacterized protein n=1 Tax=Mucor mucedo TaxID=29922 RepID=UPI00221E756E|nr:uncharacterized protein EV154DRAFT_597887 [Mucor mucedo]KAI7897057.1 hypothetical protein EV154DRAFT_597887 [Mucor mucedo]
MGRSTRSTAEKGKTKETDAVSKTEAFSQLLMGGEEEFDEYLGKNETLDDDEDEDEEPMSTMVPLPGYENDGFDDDDDDDDNDSLDAWLQDDDQYIDDNEITEQMKNSAAKRSKLKTGGQDEMEKDMEDFENNLALTSGIGLKNLDKGAKKRTMTGELRLTDDVKRKLGEANGLYIARDYGAAIDILQEVIKDNPNAHPAWNTLGLVHEELGNKAKSLQLRMVAAHMCNDTSLWKELGQKSIENDAIKQAIYCFTKALRLDPTDVDALWDRSFLHKQLGRSADAQAGFTSILELMPHHYKVINELAQLYRVQGKTKEAIQMYEDAFVYHDENADEDSDDEDLDEENEFTDKLGYSEINMLSELYLILNDYRKALDTIKNGVRKIQRRQEETWWLEHLDDDDEYLEKDDTRSDFPIELRVRMGVCRVYLNQVRLATQHFQFLLQYPATTYPDLHQDIAYAYYDKRHYDLAIKVFQRIIDASAEVEVDLLIRTADCYRETGDLETAVIFYVNVLDEQPENLDVMMSLATVYEEQGKEEEALQLVDFVMDKHRQVRKAKKADLEKENEVDVDVVLSAEEKLKQMQIARKSKNKKASIFDEERNQTKADKTRQRQDDKKRQNEEQNYIIAGLFEKVDELDEKIGGDLVNADKSLIREYRKCGQELWEDFGSTTAFFPQLRSQKFQGFYALRKGKKSKKAQDANNDSINVEAHQMASRLRKRVKTENDMDIDTADLDDVELGILEEERRNQRLLEASHFRNITFDRWHKVFIKYGYVLAITKHTEDAYELLKKLLVANIFYHDVAKKTALHLALIGCGLISDNEYITQEGMRWMCNFYQFKNDPFRLYTAVISSGKEATAYASGNQMKYVARIIRLMDAIVAHGRKKESNGEVDQMEQDEIRELDNAIITMNVDPSTAQEQNIRRFYHAPTEIKRELSNRVNDHTIKEANPIILTLLGQIMNLSRNHVASTLFYMRAYAIAPKDPLNTLSLGLALLHASMQRKTDNRHLQVMQGFMFVMEYVKLVGYCQASEYNLARAFHMIGLTHLAVPHYENVLCLPSAAKMGTGKTKPIEDVYTWPTEEEFDDEDDTDLSREAAYNLHLIYITSGSMNLAQIIMMKYCSV